MVYALQPGRVSLVLRPSTWDGSYKPADTAFQAKERFALEAQRMAAALDRRPLFHHACGNFSDMFTANIYLGPNCPLQSARSGLCAGRKSGLSRCWRASMA